MVGCICDEIADAMLLRWPKKHLCLKIRCRKASSEPELIRYRYDVEPVLCTIECRESASRDISDCDDP